MKNRILVAMFVVMAVSLMATSAFAASVQIRSGNGASEGMHDHDGVAWVAKGSLVQVIKAAGSIHSPAIGSVNPAGGDTLITSGKVGDGYLGDPTGRFTISGVTVNAGDLIYVRVWNGADFSTSTYFGNSELITVPASVAPTGDYYDIGAAGGAWNTKSPNTPAGTTNLTPPVPAPTIGLSASSFTFSAQVGTNPGNQTLNISNSGSVGTTLNWNAASDAAWLTANPASGSNAQGAPATAVTLSVNTAGLAANDYTGHITITAAGATNTPQPVTVTLHVTTVPPAESITLSAPNGGESLTAGSNTNITWSSTSITNVRIRYSIDGGTNWSVVIASTPAASGTYAWTVPNTPTTQGRVEVSDAADNTPSDTSNANFTITGGVTTPATSITIDDYEGAAGNSSNQCKSYYAFAPTGQTNPVETRTTTDVHGGTYAMTTTYPVINDPNNSWRGWGGVLNASLDLSGYKDITVWIKGDGSTTNKVKFQVKDADGTNFGISDTDAIPLTSTGWAQYRISDYQTKMTRVTGTTSGDAILDWKKVVEYQFVFSGAGASTGVIIDDLIATNVASTGPHITAITPTTGGEKVTVTITGTNFQASGGTINFAGGGTTTSIKSSDTGSLITSWADGQIVLSLPSMSRGVKTVNIVRADNTPSDNNVTFEVTGTATGGGISYNYPNPFNPLGGEKTKIVFDPGNAANVTVYIYDMTAKQIARIPWAQGAPSAQVIWDGRNIYDEIVGDGVYLYRVVDAGSNKLIGKGKILVINK